MGFLAWLASLGDALAGAFARDPAIVTRFADDPTTLWVALGVALLAGASMMVGHSGILIINGVRGLRLATAAILTVLIVTFLYLVLASLLFVGGWLLGADATFGAVARTVMLAATPLVFGFIIIVPYLGPLIARLLNLWSLFILVGLLRPLLEVGIWVALALGLGSWIAMQILGRVLAHPLDWLFAKAWQLAAGRAVLFSTRDVLAGHPLIEIEQAARHGA